MRLSIVIVSYNVKAYLRQALISIQKALQGMDADIWVVDNHSSDGSARMVQREFPGVTLIANEENVGFARANNQALRQARGDLFCLINPDTLVREETFTRCQDYLQAHDDVGMVGCKILNPDGSLQPACRRSIPTPWVAFTKITGLSALFPKSRMFGKYNLSYLDPDKITEVEAISGSFMMVKKEAVHQAGLLDETFFMYGEDLDWCYRIGKAGWRIVYLPSTEIIHYKGKSTKEASFDSIVVFYNAMRIFVEKHFSKGWYWPARWFLLLGIWIRGGISLLSNLLARWWLAFIDVAFMQLALALAILFRFGDMENWAAFQPVNLVYSLVWFLSLNILQLYRKGCYSVAKSLGAVLAGLIVNASLTFFFPQYAFSRQVVLGAGVFNGLFLSSWRLFVRLISKRQSGHGLLRHRVVIVGTGDAARVIGERLDNDINSAYEVLGYIQIEEESLDHDTDLEILGTLSDIPRIAKTRKLDEVIFSPEAVTAERVLKAVALGRRTGIEFKTVPDDLDLIIGHTSLDNLEEYPMIDLDYPIFSGVNPFAKRLFDLGIAFITLVAWGPCYLYYLLHPSFRLKKMTIHNGFGGFLDVRTFYKMTGNSSRWAQAVPLFPLVVSGKMRVVGNEIVTSDGKINLGLKPGLTGILQINHKKLRNFEDKMRYHMFYLKNYSLFLDVEILFKSLFRL